MKLATSGPEAPLACFIIILSITVSLETSRFYSQRKHLRVQARGDLSEEPAPVGSRVPQMTTKGPGLEEASQC